MSEIKAQVIKLEERLEFLNSEVGKVGQKLSEKQKEHDVKVVEMDKEVALASDKLRSLWNDIQLYERELTEVKEATVIARADLADLKHQKAEELARLDLADKTKQSFLQAVEVARQAKEGVIAESAHIQSQAESIIENAKGVMNVAEKARQEVTDRIASLDAREASLLAKESMQLEHEKQYALQNKPLVDREQAILSNNKALDEREKALQDRENEAKAVKDKELGIIATYDAKMANVERILASLEEQKQILDAREQDIFIRDKELSVRVKENSYRERLVKVKEKELMLEKA